MVFFTFGSKLHLGESGPGRRFWGGEVDPPGPYIGFRV